MHFKFVSLAICAFFLALPLGSAFAQVHSENLPGASEQSAWDAERDEAENMCPRLAANGVGYKPNPSRQVPKLMASCATGSASAEPAQKEMLSEIFETATTAVTKLTVSKQESGNRCGPWLPSSQYPGIELQVCAYSSGPGAYFRMQNRNPYAVRVRYTVVFNNGRGDQEGSTRLESGEVGGGISCHSCANENGGVNNWYVRSLHREGDEGFW
jgi:hypothetical protein